MNRLKSAVLGTLLTTVSIAAISQNANADTIPQRDYNHNVVADNYDYHQRNDELRREREIRLERQRQYRERQQREREYRQRLERERQQREQRLREERYRQNEYRYNH